MPRLKKERFNINNLNLHLEELENKKGKLNPSLAQRKGNNKDGSRGKTDERKINKNKVSSVKRSTKLKTTNEENKMKYLHY